MDLLEKHRLERKELEKRISELRKSVNVNEKKRKKEINAEITKMKEQLDKRQAEESTNISSMNHLSQQMDSTHITDCSSGFKYEIREMSKAQKKKNKKQEAEKERRKRMEEEEDDVSGLTQSKTKEAEKLSCILSQQNLSIHDIPSDGDCLYNSVRHQMARFGEEVSVGELRSKVAEYMSQFCDDFRPFMTTESGEIMSDAQFESYCDAIRETKTWGGHLELRALSECLRRRVQVIQAEGPVIELGSQFGDTEKLLLSYHRHAYILGEHYNSLIPKAQSS